MFKIVIYQLMKDKEGKAENLITGDNDGWKKQVMWHESTVILVVIDI